jgi:hypothetical protein
MLTDKSTNRIIKIIAPIGAFFLSCHTSFPTKKHPKDNNVRNFAT